MRIFLLSLDARRPTMEVEVDSAAVTVGSLKRQLVDGPEDEVRLLFRGIPLASEQTLDSCGVADGSSLRLLPALPQRSLRCQRPLLAPRGLLMTGSRQWNPTQVDAPYSANLRHAVLTPHPPLEVPKAMGAPNRAHQRAPQK